MARTRDNNWKHVIFIVLLYAVTALLLFGQLGWNKVDTPFAYEFLQRMGVAGVENLSDEAVREVWFQMMAGVYGTTVGLSVLMAALWNAIFWKAGKPSRRGLENCLFALFLALHVLMTFLVALLSGVFGFAISMVLDPYDMLAYYGLFLFNIPFILSLWLFSPVGMRSSLFKKW